MTSNTTDTDTDAESSSDTPEPADEHTQAAEQLVDASAPAVLIGEHAERHGTAAPALDIADMLTANLFVASEVRSNLPIADSAASHIGSVIDHEERIRQSDAMLVVGYEIEQLKWLVYTRYPGYGVQITPGTRDEWMDHRIDLHWRSDVPCPCAIDTALFDPANGARQLALAVTREQNGSEAENDESITVYGAPDNDLPATPPRDEVELGDTYRVATVKKCAVCHTKTNKWEITPSSRLHCPAARGSHLTAELPVERPEEHDKHKQLTELLNRREELEERLEDYSTDTESADRTVQQIHDELETIDATVQELREWFDGRFDDVEGVDPDQQGVPTFSP